MAESTAIGVAIEHGQGGGAPVLDVMGTARCIGNYRWIEMRVFEALGAWVATVPEPEVKLCLGTQSYKHAWHAELWRQALPEIGELTVERCTAPANDGVVAFAAALVEPQDAALTVEKLVGVYRVLLPRKIAAYTTHLQHANPVSDGPTIRALELALHDELDDWRAGELLVQSLLTNGSLVERAARRQATLEALLVAVGGLSGPTPGAGGDRSASGNAGSETGGGDRP